MLKLTANATKHCDVVVVGTGAAGLSVLLHLARAGVETIAVTRGSLRDSSTDWAQGGLAAVFDRNDDFESHIADTLEAGAGLCDPVAVRELVTAAPSAINRLVEMGAIFDREPDGSFDLHLEGGHSANRIVHAYGDASGAEVERTLAATLAGVLKDSRAQVWENTRVADILTNDSGIACGVRVINDDGVTDVLASVIVLASGGIGQLWPVTSNPQVATADGIAAAFRAGARVRDLEFTQFHPTVLFDSQATKRGMLISEAVRGHGAKLINSAGERFMAGKHPLAELAPRDVVSAEIMAELERSGEACVYLDATEFGDDWRTTFPLILQLCNSRGVDPISSPIPIHPAAHYSCGGVEADLDGRTSVDGLYAVGEVASTGVQGANRLASNSLTEALVAGDRLGAALASGAFPSPGTPVARQPEDFVSAESLEKIKSNMQSHAFVTRDEEGLLRLSEELGRLGTGCYSDRALTATNLATAAEIIGFAGLGREESRGCHRRSDFPDRRDEFRYRQAVVRGVHGMEIIKQPITGGLK
ncbi:L-aspartate oxidase [Propionimicrobium lymphophilum ACS-093-V-SCH5]|uniref:L-aspartate oxidase n=1 Tax=Propionimicrobium lymphophilum ACS-093-V-SCH5 TaxID=883161 RepID=S2X1K8_9ACTN|nr:L-aspartate oxidase [Propionimicrobium lymphophilum]EPD33909.1 L-aspartate oxidase [Propionimicrobium lymphophilum ACS-093-V-SCH5]